MPELFGTRTYWAKKRTHTELQFAQLAEKWRHATSKRADQFLKEYAGNIEPFTRVLLEEEASLAHQIPPGLLGGWGIGAQSLDPDVMLIGQNAFLMKLFANSTGGFGELNPSDQRFLWLLQNCLSVTEQKQRTEFHDWKEEIGARIETAALPLLQQCANGRILNACPLRYYSFSEGMLRVEPERKKGILEQGNTELQDLGLEMMLSLMNPNKRQVVVVMGKPPAKAIEPLVTAASPNQNGHILMIETFHPAALGAYARERGHVYRSIPEVIQKELFFRDKRHKGAA
jgi:hypothetical protein